MAQRKPFNPANVGLGRRRVADSRDENYHIRQLLPKRLTKRISRYWNANGGWFDQLNSNSCAGHAAAHYILDGPITQKLQLDPFYFYREAQRNDEWDGEEPQYGGTSIRAIAKVLQRDGYISGYYWAFDLQTLVDAVLNIGPVIVGTTWREQMFYPNSKGVITVGGEVAGGHAWLINGVNTKTRMFRMKNSWGNGKIAPHFNNWGKNGLAYISFDDVEKLIADYGEICLMTEIKKVA